MTKHICFEAEPYEVAESFGSNQRNRMINRQHVQKLKRAWVNDPEALPPITVNVRTKNVVDGQHRLYAYKELVKEGKLNPDFKIDVKYVDIPIADELDAIIAANITSKSWSLDDFINSYTKMNVESYLRLEEWCKQHPLTCDNGRPKYRYGAAIIKGKRCQNDLKHGIFTITEEDLTRANDVHAEMLEIVELFKLTGKGPWIESLATSWSSIRNLHEFRVWMKELKAKSQKFLNSPKENSKDWDNIFAQIHAAIDKKAA